MPIESLHYILLFILGVHPAVLGPNSGLPICEVAQSLNLCTDTISRIIKFVTEEV